MKQTYDYNFMFNQALQRIRAIRYNDALNPYGMDMDIQKQAVFNFDGHKFDEYNKVIYEAGVISNSVLIEIIRQLFELYNIDVTEIEYSRNGFYENCLMCLHDKSTKSILFFKNIEKSKFWLAKEKISPETQTIIEKYGASSYKYIYLMREKAYLQIIGHNDDANDPGRGYNAYGLKWLYETYFSKDEYANFIASLTRYEESVRLYLGYTVVHTLNPQSLISFRRITENELIKFNYNDLTKETITKNNKSYRLSEEDYCKIQLQYIKSKYYSVLNGNHDFSESLITAEWLKDSMKNAKAVDLTAIGMGYFKAAEQLLYELICLKKSEKRKIKCIGPSKEKIELTQEHINQEKIDFSIGSMAVFYRDNSDLLRADISSDSQNYIKETIFKYKDLRNGYLHRHNIHDWGKIEEIRNATFNLFFLILGAQMLDSNDLKTLGKPSVNTFDDYYMLCEYMNYHCNNVFYIINNNSKIKGIFIGCNDIYTEIIDNAYIQYSGVYIRDFGENGKKYKITKDNLPDVIYLGKLEFGSNEKVKIDMSYKIIKKIFENGKFLGDSISSEISNY